MNAPQNQAGRSCTCPSCKNVVLIPWQETTPASADEKPDQSKFDSIFTDRDKLLLDIPQQRGTTAQPAEQTPPPVSPETTAEIRQEVKDLRKKLGQERIEPPQFRKYPWFIDIFLYPLSQAGIIIFTIVVGLPLFINALMAFFLFLTKLHIPMVGLFVAVLWLFGPIIRIILWLYMLWYLYECVRDSAAAGLRAPETMAYTPSAGELFGQVMKIVACFSIFWSPFIWSCHFFGHINFTEVSLSKLLYFVASSWQGQISLAYAVFFFPMGLLRLCTLEFFLDALNPIPLVTSIFASFLPYCLLVLVFCFFTILVATVECLSPPMWALSYFFYTVEIYLLMVWSHLLGRFYWRYKEKLNWEV